LIGRFSVIGVSFAGRDWYRGYCTLCKAENRFEPQMNADESSSCKNFKGEKAAHEEHEECTKNTKENVYLFLKCSVGRIFIVSLRVLRDFLRALRVTNLMRKAFEFNLRESA
jgi:hypothetical protein